MCDTKKMPEYTKDEQDKTIGNYLRFMDLKKYHDSVTSIAEIMDAFPKVNYRHYIQPSLPLPTFAVMDGTNATCTWPMQELGRLDGAHALATEGKVFEKMNEYIGS